MNKLVLISAIMGLSLALVALAENPCYGMCDGNCDAELCVQGSDALCRCKPKYREPDRCYGQCELWETCEPDRINGGCRCYLLERRDEDGDVDGDGGNFHSEEQ